MREPTVGRKVGKIYVKMQSLKFRSNSSDYS